MGVLKNLSGAVFGRLTVIERVDNSKAGKTRYKCVCVCGSEKVVQATSLKSGLIRSCGCLNRELVSMRRTTHGYCRYGKKCKTYLIWVQTSQRCYNKSNKKYAAYGLRGITVCRRWRGLEGYPNFLADMGECPPNMSLDRVDNSGPYSPSNCRWATHKEQQRNRRDNYKIAFNGETLPISEWAEKTGIGQGTIRKRLKDLGWSVGRALMTPSRGRPKQT